MMKRMKQTGFTPLLVLALLLSGCAKNESYNTPHPDKGAVKVVTDWSGISKDAVRPDSYLVRIGELSQTAGAAQCTFEHLLPEGLHTLLVHNTPAGITISGTKAEVNTLPDGSLATKPEYLFSALKEFTAIKDDTVSVSVKMVQSIRSLTMVLKLKAGDEARIAATTATLPGIAHAIDMKTGQADLSGTGKTIKPLFELGSVAPSRATVQPAHIATVRLAGVVSSGKQLLTLAVTMKDGSEHNIETDLTAMLKEFGKMVKPLTLDATIELPTEAGATGTITNWVVVDNGNITIH